MSPLRESCRRQEHPTGIMSANATLRKYPLDFLGAAGKAAIQQVKVLPCQLLVSDT